MNQHYQKNKVYLNKRRVLCYQSRGLDKQMVANMEKEHGLDKTILLLKIKQAEMKLIINLETK